ncbi:MAG: Ig-like domain-containing protein [Paludibacteraceae bacterium]|nr:Ig-like domain-containing protein [Paludibacteraceae bacterium]
MKANKFFAVALAALTLVGFNACKDNNNPVNPTTLTLNESAITVAKDATFLLTANMTVTWSTSNAAVASVSATGMVTGIAAGNATITATSADNQTASCQVTVTDGGVTPPPVAGYADFAQLQGQEYFVFFLQGGATQYLGNKVVYNFGPNDHEGQGSRWLYIWSGTFGAGTPVGSDPFDMTEGWTSLVQGGTGGWAGAGLCVAINDGNNTSGEGADEDLAALNLLKTKITNYNEWYLAVALKNTTQNAAYEFAVIGSNVFDPTKIDEEHPNGQGVESGVGKVVLTPAATGEWVYIEKKLSEIPGLEFDNFTTNGSNILTIVATPYMAGVQMDLGYAFIYKK